MKIGEWHVMYHILGEEINYSHSTHPKFKSGAFSVYVRVQRVRERGNENG